LLKQNAEYGKDPLLKALSSQTLLADGAMGTYLYHKGISSSTCLEELNLSRKDTVESVHRDYIMSGAQIIETNTFGANRYQLANYHLEGKVWDINIWGVKIARQAREVMGKPVFVAGSVGPLGQFMNPLGNLTQQKVYEAYREQVEALLAGGVDCFFVESMVDVHEGLEAVRAVKDCCKLPVSLQFTFTADKVTPIGESSESIMDAINQSEYKPDIVGLNCGAGPQKLLDILYQMRDLSQFDCYWALLPDAGMPARLGNRNHYLAIPEYFAGMVEDILDAGANIIGGCCGTTPMHIKAMHQRLSEILSEGNIEVKKEENLSKPRSVTVISPDYTVQDKSTVSGLKAKLNQGFVISVELDPPKGALSDKFIQAAGSLKESGVDTINVADSPMARVRMGAIPSAHLLTANVGVETIIHFTTRDRNLMGIQSDLLGAHALGIHNVLALTGDPPSLGNVRNSTPVYDVDSIGLIHILQGLNQGMDVAGNSIGESTSFTIGCALSPNAQDIDLEVERFKKKYAAGIDFVMTQPIYKLEPLYNILERIGEVSVPILLGIMPLHSYKQAEYLHNEVPGISIPDEVRQELKEANENGLQVGLAQAEELIKQAKDLIAGIYIVGSFGKYEPITQFISHLRSSGWE
jgi:methionine synthase I (cobalamin-dependent)/5,10-methylenetetrahydrofolate reductase